MSYPSLTNPYDDTERATSYAKLEITGTYYLAFRDLPYLFKKYGMNGSALDYGCGSGRSTRFLRDQGFSTVGVDISPAMISIAREQDFQGSYNLITSSGLRNFPNDMFDLVLSVMPFDSIATEQAKVDILVEMGRVLKPSGYKVLVAASHELYLREWLSFSSADFPDNRRAKSGDTVRIIIEGMQDRRAVEDTLWTEAAYVDVFQKTPLQLLETIHPVASTADEYQPEWISEQMCSPWTVFVLENSRESQRP